MKQSSCILPSQLDIFRKIEDETGNDSYEVSDHEYIVELDENSYVLEPENLNSVEHTVSYIAVFVEASDSNESNENEMGNAFKGSLFTDKPFLQRRRNRNIVQHTVILMFKYCFTS